MYVIETNHLSKNFGEREIINIEQLKIEEGQRIGIVGANGAGKTTLLKLLGKQLEPDTGRVCLNVPAVYWSQTEAPDKKEISPEMASRFGVPTTWRKDLSGGEKTRFKAAAAFQFPAPLMLVDEPTTNLDMEGIEQLEQYFTNYNGTLLIISHDRHLLDALCSHIIEVESGHMRMYKGNYSEYEALKEAEVSRQQLEFDGYQQEKKRLRRAVQQTSERSAGMKKTPSRMGNSEARLHKMGNQASKKNLDKAANRLKTKLDQLEEKKRPLSLSPIQMDVKGEKSLHKRNVVQVDNLTFGYGNNNLFHRVSFRLEKDSHTALLGPNGCGKSTLIRLLLERHPAISVAQKARMGYFDQHMNTLDMEKTILANAMEEAMMPETSVRTLLAKFLFPGEEVNKKVKVLSGGERVKVSLAKILLQGFNLLILDEPTNHLDITSIKVVEEALQAYDGTLLLVSHDRHLVSQVANRILLVEDRQVSTFPGTYQEFRQHHQHLKTKQHQGLAVDEGRKEETMMVLENRKTQLLSRLSAPAPEDDVMALDEAYQEVLRTIKAAKKD